MKKLIKYFYVSVSDGKCEEVDKFKLATTGKVIAQTLNKLFTVTDVEEKEIVWLWI